VIICNAVRQIFLDLDFIIQNPFTLVWGLVAVFLVPSAIVAFALSLSVARHIAICAVAGDRQFRTTVIVDLQKSGQA
jgi:hypothetical protein